MSRLHEALAIAVCRLLSGLAMLIAASLQPAMAHLELSEEEREIVGWSRNVAPNLQVAEPPERVTLVDEYIRRSLLLGRCPATPLWQSPDRWFDRRYQALLREWAQVLDRLALAAAGANTRLEIGLEALLIFAWRSWDRPAQLEWLHYMRSPESKRGLAWWFWITELEAIEGYATDVSSGKPIPVWVNWVGELLAVADLSTAFVRAANAQEAGLGDMFAAQLAWSPAQVPSADQRRARDDLVERLLARWDDIVAAVPGFADPETVRMGRTWADHPVFQRLMNAVVDMNEDFLAEAGLGHGQEGQIREALLLAMRVKADEICAALR